ncbi:TrgA family protein [Aliiruegeria sabulilitoris]|uniref:TrgA family protein n=1 Tax=Aliiruegeria sabulilitoris TaxID=1510458 RepID=UPI00082E9B76|nr:TrgA family protein [Aliiruegeria sabulilitoris]NDR58318.1 TrgA family protein [Pseudoruegeria sp. M32A2M]
MPTAAKLFAAFGFALVAFFASEVYKPLLPEGTQFAMLTPINTFIGAVCGWMNMGQLAGKGSYAAIGSAIRTVGVMLFYVLVLWAGVEMLERSVSLYYDGPTEALIAMMDLVAEYFLLMLSGPEVPIVLICGGVLAALLSEWASERWA